MKGGHVHFLGHATLLIEVNGVTLLTDPISRVLRGNAQFKTFLSGAKKRPPLDIVLISHSHRDHFDPKALRDIEASFFILPERCFRLFPKKRNALLVEMRPWEVIEIKGLKIRSLPALHLSWLHPYPLLTPSLSYLIEFDNLGLYFAGDTGFCRRLFKGIGQSFKIDIAFLPVGPDDLLFKWYHLGAKDAIRAYKLLGAKVFIPIHWGVVKGTSGDSLKTVRKLLGFSLPYLRLLNVGDKVSLGELLNREGAFAPPDLNFLKQV